MTRQDLIVDGKTLSLGKRIGKGGEGEVFLLADDPTRAVKLYTIPDTAAREPKIAAIVRMGLGKKSSLTAFPLAIVRDQAGLFKGFVMHFVPDHKPVFEVYGPQARKQNFPTADYRFLARAATNTAKAVADVHQTRCVIGDINHSGILVSDKAKVALIDADSFQVFDGNERYLCRVGVPEYTPPELQGKRLGEIVRTENHDAFGLAIAIFQLLAMGRHPFAGTYAKGEMPIQRAISEFRFAYSRNRSVGMTPPPGVSTLDDFPPLLASAFETAFGPTQQKARPTAAEWVTLLGDFERTLKQCSKNALHYHSEAAASCPWCRMEQKLHIILFLPKDLGLGILPISHGDKDEFNFGLLWAQVEAIKVPSRAELTPVFPTLALTPSSDAIIAKQHRARPGWLKTGGVVAGIVLALAVPALWLLAVGIAIAGFVFAGKVPDPAAALRQRLIDVEDEWSQALDQWEKRTGIERTERLKASLVESKQAYHALDVEESDRVKCYERERKALQKAKYLENFRIRNRKIQGIGPAKLAMLASYGIETAADITREKVLRVPGFGPVNSKPLLEWQKTCAHGFIYNPAQTAADQYELNKIKAEIHQRKQSLRNKLKSEAQQFASAVQTCRELLSKGTTFFQDLNAKRTQLEADLNYLDIPVPPRPVRFTPRPNPPTPAPSTFRAHTTPPPAARPHHAQSIAPACPRCSSSMVKRTARRGIGSGKPFWGCSRYPGCRGTRPI